MSDKAFLRNVRLKKENFLNMSPIITLSIFILCIKKGRLKSALEKSLLSGFINYDTLSHHGLMYLNLLFQRQA
jgi:hypothetical protein